MPSLQNPRRFVLILAALAFLIAPALEAQIKTPRVSPAASVSQTIGATVVSIDYHRPSVKGREVFGGLVPWDQVWRTGANENTVFSTDGPILIEGQELAAGTYGLHTIPSEGSWTLIFSKVSDLWGSGGYDEANDALRVQVPSRDGAFTESMLFHFDNTTVSSAEAVLAWAEVEVPFSIRVDLEADLVKAVRGERAQVAQGLAQAASFALGADGMEEKAALWAGQAVDLAPGFGTHRLAALAYAKVGRTDDAIAAAEAALAAAESMERQPSSRLLDSLRASLDEWKKAD